MAVAEKATRVVNEAGEEIYPCRCGQTHEGEYAAYEYGHHNCFHEAPLSPVGGDQYCCPDCGKDFWISARPHG